MKKLIFKTCFLGFIACFFGLKAHSQNAAKPDFWRATISHKYAEIPFLFSMINDSLQIINVAGLQPLGKLERIKNTDSTRIQAYIFDAHLIFKHINPDSVSGYYTNPSGVRLAFAAKKNMPLWPCKAKKPFALKWQTHFYNSQKTSDSNSAIGVFEQKPNGAIFGSFLSATGDYRYLSGQICADDSLRLSGFDGSGLYFFKAHYERAGGRLSGGRYYAGSSTTGVFWAQIAPKASLPDPYTLSQLRPEYQNQKMSFSFKNPEGRVVSFSDSEFVGRPIIIQILGSWCPNCLDESLFLKNWQNQNPDSPVRIVGLAFERKSDFNYSSARIINLKKRLGLAYPILIAGISNKDSAAAALPMLSRVVAFPTTIFLDKNANIIQIHSGFAGPATGKYYQDFKGEFEQMIKKISK